MPDLPIRIPRARPRILAIDPGTERHGWALVELTGTAKVQYLESGHDATDLVLAPMTRSSVDLVAIERPVFIPKKAQAMMQVFPTAEIAGVFRGRALERGVIPEMITAGTWRNALCGTNHPNDATVKNAVRVFVLGLPARSNNHERDALGLAIVASWRFGRKAA